MAAPKTKDEDEALTYPIPHAARLYGISRGAAYELARRGAARRARIMEVGVKLDARMSANHAAGRLHFVRRGERGEI